MEFYQVIPLPSNIENGLLPSNVLTVSSYHVTYVF